MRLLAAEGTVALGMPRAAGADPGDLHAYSHGNQRPVMAMPPRSRPLALCGCDTQGLATARDEPGRRSGAVLPRLPGPDDVIPA